MSTRPRHDNSRGGLFRRLVSGDAGVRSRVEHVALAERFLEQPQAPGVLRALHMFLRDQLRSALAIPIAIAAEDLEVQGPVLEAIDRAIDGLAEDPMTQRDFMLSFLAVVGVNALSSAAAFRSGVVRFAAACAENLTWDELSELRRGLPGSERWFQRPRKTLDLMLLPEEQRDVLREAYYEFRSKHDEVIAALRGLIDRLRGQPLGTMHDAGRVRPLDQVVRYIMASASELWGSSFASYGPPELPDWASTDIESVRRDLVLPGDATNDLLYTRFIWSTTDGRGTTHVLSSAPRPATESGAPVQIRVPVPIVMDDPTRVPRRLTRAYAKNMHEALLQQFREAEKTAESSGRRMVGPRRRHDADADHVKLIARRLDLRAAGLGPTQVAATEEAETGRRPPLRTVQQSITDAARSLGIEKLPSVPGHKWRDTQARRR